MSSKVLPRDITSYDLLKAFAVVIMIIDHIGFYFFPEALWWRAVGRIGFPVWFFLVGHASGRDLPAKLLWGIGILTVGNILSGMPLFPLNALMTIALIRLVIDPVMAFALRSKLNLWGVGGVLFLLAIPTSMLSEYGTMALITAMFGYMVRHQDEIKNDEMIVQFMLFALLAFVVLQYLVFSFSVPQIAFVAFGTAIVRLRLYYFEAASYPEMTQKLAAPLRAVIQICGRRTLEIYVVHLFVFKMLAMALGIEDFGFLDWKWIDI